MRSHIDQAEAEAVALGELYDDNPATDLDAEAAAREHGQLVEAELAAIKTKVGRRAQPSG